MEYWPGENKMGAILMALHVEFQSEGEEDRNEPKLSKS